MTVSEMNYTMLRNNTLNAEYLSLDTLGLTLGNFSEPAQRYYPEGHSISDQSYTDDIFFLFNNCSLFNDSSYANCSYNSSNSTSIADQSTAYPLWLQCFLAILAGIVSVVTILGNFMVLLSFAIDRSIRQPTNYFIASLAASDLLIGMFSMPLYTLYGILGSWPLGPWLCDIWLSLDWTVCLASQYTVFFITVDRFCSVKIPAKYRNWRTEKKVIIMVTATWVLPTVVFFTSVIGWQFFVGKRTVAEDQCSVQFMENPLFTLFLTVGYYWITLVVMCGLYSGIYTVALKLQQKSEAKHRKLTTAMGMMADQNKSAKTESVAANPPSVKRLKAPQEVGVPRQQRGVSTTSFSSSRNNDKDEDRSSSPAFPSDEENSSNSPSHKKEFPKEKSKSSKFKGRGSKSYPAENNIVIQTECATNDSKKNLLEVSPNHIPCDLSLCKVYDGEINVDDRKQTFCNENIIMCEDVKTKKDVEKENVANIIDPFPHTDTCLLQVSRGSRYIDDESLKSLAAAEKIKLLSEPYHNLDDNSNNELSSPVWKKRNFSDISFGLTNAIDESAVSQATVEVNIDKPSTSSENNRRSSSANLQTTAVEEKANGKTMNRLVKPANVQTLDNDCPPTPTSGKNKKSGSPLQILVKSVSAKREKSRRRSKKEKGKSKSENRARKALRTITFILGAFVLCWTPYHVMVFIIGVNGDYEGLNMRLYEFTYWLCYLNSPINPFCYAFANVQFKRTFLRILKLDWHRT